MKLEESKALCLALVVLASTAVGARGSTDKGLAIARQVDGANSGFVSEIGDAKLLLLDGQGARATRQLSIRARETAGDGDRSVVTFTAPADVAGTRLLTWAHPKSADDQWLFLPAIHRVKRISGRNKAGSFMGSEFSYEDLASSEVDDFTYRFVEETSIQSKPTWVYERRPIDPDSGYQREVLWVIKELMQPVKIEFYDRRNELLKVARFSAFRKYGRFFRPGVVEMENVQTGKKSELRWTTYRLGDPVPEDELRPDALGH